MSEQTTVIYRPDSTAVILREDGQRSQVTVKDTSVIVESGGGIGPQGAIGPPGPAGPVPIYVGPTPPINTSLLWVDTSV